MRRFTVLAFALVALWGLVAHAQAFTACVAGMAVPTSIGAGDAACYDFTGTTDSRVFAVTSARGFVDFDPDVNSTGGAGTIYLVRCTSSIFSANSCFRKLTDQDQLPGLDDLPLNGDETTNHRRISLEPGWWVIDVQTGAGGSTARALITGGN